MKKYTCTTCKKQFDSPKSEFSFDSVRAVCLNLIMILICAVAFSFKVLTGCFFLLIYAIGWAIFLFSMYIFGKKECPYCKSKNFYENS